MCKEGWCVELGQEGVAWGWGGGTVWNTLKGGGKEKSGGETKILKGGQEQAGSRGGCLKKRGTGTPLWTMNTPSIFLERGVKQSLDKDVTFFIAPAQKEMRVECCAGKLSLLQSKTTSFDRDLQQIKSHMVYMRQPWLMLNLARICWYKIIKDVSRNLLTWSNSNFVQMKYCSTSCQSFDCCYVYTECNWSACKPLVCLGNQIRNIIGSLLLLNYSIPQRNQCDRSGQKL